MDVIKLAKILDEEFEKDNWGDIDPWLFKVLGKNVEEEEEEDEDEEDEEDEKDEEVENLRQVLNRVVKRINEQ